MVKKTILMTMLMMTMMMIETGSEVERGDAWWMGEVLCRLWGGGVGGVGGM